MQRFRSLWLAFSFAASFILPGATLANTQVDFEVFEGDHVAITVNGQPFSNFYIGTSYPKPFLAPLRAPTGQIVTRKFPIENVPGESRDHQHHRGLFIGYGDVSGINFWENEFEYKPTNKGKMVVQHLGAPKPGTKSGSITATIAWQDPSGATMIEEQRTMTIYDHPEQRTIDIESVLTAKRNVRFADTKEGFFAIRLADSMSEKNGGLMSNAEGAQTEKNVWGKRSDWVDYDGIVEGQKIGVVIFDNPANPNHPPHWHSRAYGLFAVNPFGLKDFETNAAEQGGMPLSAGESLRFRWRVVIHHGDVPMKKVSQWYIDYKKKAK